MIRYLYSNIVSLSYICKINIKLQIQLYKKIKLSQMKKQAKKIIRDPIIINITKLAQNIIKAQSKNTLKYNQIKQINSDFQFKLYKPTIPPYESRQELSLAEDIMMRQLDKLMDQEEKLNIQLNKNMYKHKEQQKKFQKQVILNMDHYTFLRKLWKKDQKIEGTDQKVDRLIHNVGAIKGHIYNLIKRQTQLTQSAPDIHQLVISSPQYCHLLKKYEKLKQQSQIKQMQQKYQTTNNTSQSSIQSQDTKKMNQQLQAELSRLKLELVNKNNQLQRLRRAIVRGRQWRNSYHQGNQEKQKQGQETKQNEQAKQKLLNYLIKSYEGRYIIKIQQLNDDKQQATLRQYTKNQNTIEIQSKQTLDSIVTFLKNPQSRRLSRASMISVQKKQSQFGNRKQNETASKKYTVEQIARPKFISNRQIINSSKSNENIHIQ